MGQQRKHRQRRTFSDEFKRDAVALALVLETGRPIAHVARELGIYDSSLGDWVKAARDVAFESRGVV